MYEEWLEMVHWFLQETQEPFISWEPAEDYSFGNTVMKDPQFDGPEDPETGNREWEKSWRGELLAVDYDNNTASATINWGGDPDPSSNSGYVYTGVPDSFSGYEYAFHLWTKAPNTASSGSDIMPSDPIPLGETYSFYVQDGYPGSPFAFTTEDDYNLNGFLGTVSDYGMTVHAPVPVPGAIWLFGSGLVGLCGIRARAKAKMS